MGMVLPESSQLPTGDEDRTGADRPAPSQPQRATYDAIVIGAGIQGSFAAYHLARRHKDTLLLEQLESCRRSLGDTQLLDAVTLAQRFPGLRLHPGEVALWDGTAGVLFADRALRAVQDVFRRHGGTLRDGEKVLSIQPGAVLTVTTTAGMYRAPRLIITAGAWTGALLAPLGLHLPLQPLRIDVCYWREKEPGTPSAGRTSPCFMTLGLSQAPHGIYGLPALEYPGLVKVCHHHGSPTDPEERDWAPPGAPHPDVTLLSTFISNYLPGLEPQPAVMETCLYTNTPDEDFILDRHPEFSNIIIGAGFSGHGFKLSPVVGKLLCELSLGEEPSHSMAPFAISRFLRAAL
ncbi:PREDICTED: peroxisomal sarcosine oxidase [Chaetura pelagica]|uniref:peroxisomal sarcosine oxidase n=1 Tax=Chaetura pelagica TaxID=8897 RepID=UPI000523D1DE|nr:PREDICTED: peroxisomal sarcosine oxidase [Chaetura pelagica]